MLFNLQNDPFELKNLYRGQISDDVKRLVESMQKYVLEAIEDEFQPPIQGSRYKGNVMKKIKTIVEKTDLYSSINDYYKATGRVEVRDEGLSLASHFCELGSRNEFEIIESLRHLVQDKPNQSQIVDYYAQILNQFLF